MERGVMPERQRLLSTTRLPFVSVETKTFGLAIEAELWEMDDGTEETYYMYCLPDGVQVIALTPENKIIAITEWQPAVGKDYTHAIGETTKKNEEPLAAAKRGLREETGYDSDEFFLLSSVLENSGKSRRCIHLILAQNCVKTGVGEEKIKVQLFSPADFWAAMTNYLFTNPEIPHGGGNTLKAAALAYHHLGLLTIGTPTAG